MRRRFLLLMLLSAFSAPAQRPADVTVRMRLFAAAQPGELRILRENAPPQRVWIKGESLLVDERRILGPLRLMPPLRLQVEGAGDAIPLRHPTEITARDGALLIVTSLPREDYVAGVLSGEATVFRSEESLKAMAVAARTFAAFHMSRHKAEGFDFCDTTHCQDYRGVTLAPRVERAATSTRGEFLWYRGALLEALYHQDCGGITESQGGRPAVHDAYCTARGRRQWKAELTRAELQSALELKSIESVAITSRSPSGRAALIRVQAAPSRTLSAEMFRLAVGRVLGWNRLRSDLYEVRRSGDLFIFEGYGAGHGIGLCQNGAAAMGELGKTYKDILAFYYPGAIVAQTPSGAAWIRRGGATADLESTQAQDSALLEKVEQQMAMLERSTGLLYEVRPLVRFYPSVAAYRDTTGEPGWMAASTRDNTIRLQPVTTLRSSGTLEATLFHELAHVLIESKAHPSVPRWFREGLVLWLTESSGPVAQVAVPADLGGLERSLTKPASEAELRRAYREARAAVAGLAQKHSRDVVLSWLRKGLPQTR